MLTEVSVPDRAFGRSVLTLLRSRAMQVRAGEVSDPERRVEASPEAYAELFDALMLHSLDGVTLNDRESRVFIEVSESFCRLTGYSRAELLGRTSVELGLVDPGGVHAVSVDRVDAGQDGLYATDLFRKDGAVRHVEFSQQILGEEFVLTILRDITVRRDLESEMRRLADIDPLTGLPNHSRFAQDVDIELRRAARFADVSTLIVIDIDGMTFINDVHGRDAGDLALKDVADALRTATGDAEVIGRLGGDEFAVLLTRHESEAPQRLIGAITSHLRTGAFATRIGEPVTVSFGVTQTVGQAGLEAMLAEASVAMSQSRRSVD